MTSDFRVGRLFRKSLKIVPRATNHLTRLLGQKNQKYLTSYVIGFTVYTSVHIKGILNFLFSKHFFVDGILSSTCLRQRTQGMDFFKNK